MPVYKGSTLVNDVNVTIEKGVSSGGITPAGTINISSNGTYDVTEYASANVNVPEKEFTTQTKTATPSTSQQIITPDSGYDGLSQITVEAMPSGSLSTPTISSSGLITAQVGTSGYLASGTSVTKQLTTQAAKTVTPTASEQTVVNSAVYTTGAVKVAAVPSETKNITANGTYTPSSGKFFSSVTVNVPEKEFTTQTKTATPSTSEQTITPDPGYDGLSSVIVEAMPSGTLNTPTVDSSGLITAQVGASGYLASGAKATKQLTTQIAQTITPSTADQTISSGLYLTGAQTIKGDANLVAGNIKSGVSIFGVAGSFEGSGGGGGSSDNNCEAYHITSASATLNFKTTGTVKVWGYGYKSSGYMGTHYSFAGDSYYYGSYGTPRKTSATFSIASDGTLSGLPSGLTEVDLLVTIGV